MSYVLRAPRPAALLPLLGIPAFVALVELAGLPGFPVFVLIAAAVLIAFQAWQRSLVLKVDADGIRIGRGVQTDVGAPRTTIASVPWSSIRDVVVIGAGVFGGAATRVGVRLKPGAPLPDGAHAVVSDPREPDAIAPTLSTAVPDRFDRERLEAAVTANGGTVVDVTR